MEPEHVDIYMRHLQTMGNAIDCQKTCIETI